MAVYTKLMTNDRQVDKDYIIRFEEYHWKNKTTKTILIWTKFFGVSAFFYDIQSCISSCDRSCHVTNDKEQLPMADALVFHMTDINLEEMPKLRFPNQVWILFILESSHKLTRDYSFLNNMFNWTMSYRTSSTVFAPYGTFVKRDKMTDNSDSRLSQTNSLNFVPQSVLMNNQQLLNETEKNQAEQFWKQKTKMSFAAITNCNDYDKRYRLLNEIQHHFSVDYYGKCGEIPCIQNRPFDCLPTNEWFKYKYRLAFENCQCRDYITEKFWTALWRGSVIPIVNWRDKENEDLVPPKSFINVFSFPNIKSLTDYLKIVASNVTLYNEYFTWKKNFKILRSYESFCCSLCQSLYEPKQAQLLTDVEGWLKDDSCPRYSVCLHKIVLSIHSNFVP